MIKLFRSTSLTLIALVAAFSGYAPLLADVLIEDVAIVDVETGKVLQSQSVLIEDNRISQIAEEIDAREDIARIDGTGRFLIPGLWDSHVHIFSSADEPTSALPMYLINGITGVRDMGALWPIAAQQQLQQSIENGNTVGPRLILSGAWVDATPGSWPGMFLADTPAQARHAVEQIEAEGWAAVKSYSMLDEATYLALAASTGAAELPLVGHIPERVALLTAVKAGQNGMEHFGRIPMACSTAEGAMLEGLRSAMVEGAAQSEILAIMASRNRTILETWEHGLCQRVLESVAQAKMHVSPTLVVADFYLGNWPAPDTPRMQMVPAAVRKAWGKPDFRLEAMTDEVRALAEQSIALDRKTFLMAHRAGVPILASTDASFANPYLFHGFSLIDELELYVEIGLTPREALFTATVAPPRFFGLEDQDGTIDVGKRADLVLLNANPLEGLATLREPEAVIVNGRLLDRDKLDEMEQTLFENGQAPTE